jgi:abhydrolase domain-containing protein 14
MKNIVSKKIEVENCSLHFLEAGDGQDIVLLHGMKFQAATWQELGTLEFLADSGKRSLAVDMPGFGLTPECALEQDSVLAAFVDQETTGKPILIGPSMGGRIVLEFALNHPDKVSGLILVGAVGVEENRQRLAEIKVPTLLIWGGDDQISPLTNSDVLLAEINGAKRVIVEGAPHPCYLDHTKMFHEAIGDFLSSLS